MDPASEHAGRESRLQAALMECLELLEQGMPPDLAVLAQKYPDLADELAAFLSNHARLDALLGAGPAGRLGPPAGRELLEATLGSAISSPAPGSCIRYFGNYELLEEIARGGMGVVYKARQTNLKRTVALKLILTGQLATSEDVKRFHAEAQAAARLEHRHIVPIFEIGQAEGQHYFSMALVEGESLAQRIARGVLPPREAAELMYKVAQAIAYAHVEGVIHRDLKPANILLDQAGEPHVTDFGLAKRVATEESGVSSREQLTATGQILGTPSYMPPEQASGKTHELGPQADVYALGAVLYCVLAGRPPFQAATPLDTLLQVIDQDPVPLRQLNAAIPRDLETIAMKCLEKAPAMRYATAADLAEDLRRFLHDEPIKARPVTPAERAWRWLRKQRRSVGLTAVAAAATLLLGGLAVGGWYWYQDWWLGYIFLETDRPPMVAELVDDAGQPAVAPFTVPTQVPIALPAGEYELRLSAVGRLSQRYRVTVQRGPHTTPAHHTLNLEDSLLRTDWSTTLDVSLSHALVTREGRADVVLLEESGIRHPAWPNNSLVWRLELIQPQQHAELKQAPGLRWPWYQTALDPQRAFAVWHPWVDSPADLDADGAEDIVVSARHQAWIMAVSARNGNILWLAARGPELGEASPQQDHQVSRWSSTVLARPLPMPDCDGDGTADLIAAFASQDRRTPPARWIECLSGRTGQTLWRMDLDDAWFQTPGPVDLPEEAKWYVDVNGYSSESGGSFTTGFGEVLRRFESFRVSGMWYPALFSPLLLETEGRMGVVVAAGTRLLGLDPATGQPLWPPIDLTVPCVSTPQAADLDGDNQPEVLLAQPTGVGTTIPGTAVCAWSISRRVKLWHHALAMPPGRGQAPPEAWARLDDLDPTAWVRVDDLDGDGRTEVILCDIAAWAGARVVPWADLVVLETAAGGARERWRRSIKTTHQIIHFATGPDINGDGVRDIFAASMYERSGEGERLHVDALSGVDGQTLWWGSKQTDNARVSGLSWWRRGTGGWPQLLVSTERDQRHGTGGRGAFVFSADMGEFVTDTAGFDDLRLADADGDGAAEWFLWNGTSRQPAFGSGQLYALRATPAEVWRRAGGTWHTAGDLDGDGWADLVGFTHADTIAAVSGADGRCLWHRTAPSDLNSVQPLDADLDGDGTTDVLAFRDQMQGITAFTTKWQFPMAAISGRTGKRLWSVEIPFSSIGGVMFAAARDLDGDTHPEVVFSVWTNWDYPPTAAPSISCEQHWLATLDGRTGKFRWRQPLSCKYGMPDSPTHRSYDTYGVRLTPVFADLNGDGTLDVILPAETTADPARFELRALDGADGSTLWRRRLITPANDYYSDAFANLATPLAGDLDGNGTPEVLLLEYVDRQPAAAPPTAVEPGEGQATTHGDAARLARLTALTNSGRQMWQARIPVDELCGRAHNDSARQAVKPLPQMLHTRDGAPLVCVGLWGGAQPGKIVVLDAAGRHVAQRQVAAFYSYFRPWIYDVNGDGGDDVLVISENKLLALDPASQLATVWEWPLPPSSDPHKIIGVVRGVPARHSDDGKAAAARMPAVLVQATSRLYGISGPTGTPIWHWSGPLRYVAGDYALAPRASFLAHTGGCPARAVFHIDGELLACVEAHTMQHSSPVAGGSPGELPDLRQPGHKVGPVTRAGRPDPRLRRELRVGPSSSAEMIGEVAWALLNSIALVVLPGWMLLYLLRRRTWGMGTVLTLPLLAALVAAVLALPVPEGFFAPYGRGIARWLTALNFAPVVVFSVAFFKMAVRHRWWLLLAWAAVWTAQAALFTGTRFFVDVRTGLGPGERYALAVRPELLMAGYYVTSWTYVIGYVLLGLLRLAIRRFDRRARRAPTGQP